MTGNSPAPAAPRLAWALTGSGHYIKETLDLMARFAPLDVFLSKAAEEVMRMYRRRDGNFPLGTRLFRDRAASAPQIGRFYFGEYHTLVVGPATSNTVAKCVQGISDTLPTNAFAQAGKCRVPCIVFACDTAPEMMTEAPHGMVPVYPRRIDLENVDRLRGFEATTVVETVPELEAVLATRLDVVRPERRPVNV